MKKLILIAVVVAMAAGVLALGFYFMRAPNGLLSKSPEHGQIFLLEISAVRPENAAQNLASVKEVLRKRFLEEELAMFWEPISATQVRVVAPVPVNKKMKAAVERAVNGGRLEFRLVHEDSEQLLAGGITDVGFETLKQKESWFAGGTQVRTYLVKKKPEMTGEYIQNAVTMRDESGRPEIAFTLTAGGREIFAKVTRDNIGRQIAIVLDGQLLSAPKIQGEIGGGNGVISGQFTDEEAAGIAWALNNPLPVPVKLLEMKTF